MWNGEATVVLASGEERYVCAADMQCSALMVDDASEADALLAAAEAALVAGGFEEAAAGMQQRRCEAELRPGRRYVHLGSAARVPGIARPVLPCSA